ncbi:MAG: YicC family protein [Bacteroidia bacterium]|nr:YicC family protein [Bacteroidia bacterium]
MTGYGRSTRQFREKMITVDIKSLNSKFMDLRIRSPQNYRTKESEVRKVITDVLSRGKIELNIDIKSDNGADVQTINKRLFRNYYQDIKVLQQELDFESEDVLQAILRIPNVISLEEGDVDEEEWSALRATLNAAIEEFNKFRLREGQAMEKDLIDQIHDIESLLNQVDPLEKSRIDKIKVRLNRQLEEHLSNEKIDRNRFEQEVIYYLEKIDITEEKVRLAQHCKYFLEILQKQNVQKGKKLAFISQEMGREINTLGAKAYSSELQKLVVTMKDNLEKIKEQLANAC